MTAPPGGDVGVLEGRGDQRSDLSLMKRSPSAARSLAVDGAPRRGGGSGGSQRSLDVGGQPTKRTPSAESQRRRNKEGGGGGADGPPQVAAGKTKASSSETWLRHVASDGNISHVVQLEREMATELAQDAADVAEVPGPRHVKYATVMANNLRRDSQRASTPELGQGGANTRMTQDERRELARAQREVMWNLQKDEVVTIVRQGDKPVPYKRQGNPAVNTPICVRKRLALRNKPLIQEIINEYWCFPGLNPEGSGEMTKESYVKLNRKLHLALIPDTTDEDAETSAEVDWSRDTARWDGKMSKTAFASSMFELADIWTENINEEEYTAFLWLLLETITNTNVVPPSFKPDKEIECIVDEELSEATNRMRDALADELGRERDSLPLDVDGITALLADKSGRRDTLSPQLKEKYIQRLRTLRKRLQALKELRTWPVLEAAVGAETTASEGWEHNKGAAFMGRGGSNGSEDFRTITSDSGTISEFSANNLGGVSAGSEGAHADTLDAEPLGSAVPPGNSSLGLGHRILGGGGGGAGVGGGAVGDGRAPSMGRNTTEQQLKQGEESARGVNNRGGEGRQQTNVLPQPSGSGALTLGSGESGGKEPAGKLDTGGGPDESVGVSRRGKNSEGMLDSGRGSAPKEETLGNDSGREDGGMPAEMPLSGLGGAGSGAGTAEARVSHKTDIGHPQSQIQQQRSDSAADDRGNRAAASTGPVSDTTPASALKHRQEGDTTPAHGTRDVDMGNKSSSKRGGVGEDDESRRGGRGDKDTRDSAGVRRVEDKDNHSNRIVQFEAVSGGTRGGGGGLTGELQGISGSDGDGSDGHARTAGLASERQDNGVVGAGDISVTVAHGGETQSTGRAGSRNGGNGRSAGDGHEHSPNSTAGTAGSKATNTHSTAGAGLREGAAAVAGYSGNMDGVTRGDTDGVHGHAADEDSTEKSRYTGTGTTSQGRPGSMDEGLRKRDGANTGTEPIDPRSGNNAGGYDAARGAGHQGDTDSEQRTAAQTSPEQVAAADYRRDGDGGGGRGDHHHGSERAPTPSQTSRRTSDSGRNSDTLLVQPGETEYAKSSAIAGTDEGKSGPMQSEGIAEKNRDAGEEMGETEVEHGDPGGRRKVSFDVGGSDASSTPTRPSVAIHDRAFHPNPGGSPGGSPSGWDGISGTSDEQWESMIGRAETEKRQRASRSVAGGESFTETASPSGRPGAQTQPTGRLPPSTATDPPGPSRTEEETEAAAAAPGHSTGTPEGLPDVDDHSRGDLSDSQASAASGRPNLKRKTRSNSLEAGESQGLEPHGGNGGNPDDPSDDRGRVGRESSPTMEHGSPADLSSAVRDPNMKVEPTVPSGSEETRQLNSRQGFDLEQAEGRSNDHGAPEKGTIDSDSDGLALRPGEYGEDTSSMALQSHVGDETTGAHARKVSTSFTAQQDATGIEGEGLLGSSAPSEGIPAHLQPVSDNQNTPSKGILDRDSMVLKPQGASSVATPDHPADTGGVNDHHTLPHSSKTADGSALGDDLPRTNAATSLADVGRNNDTNTLATGDSRNREGGEARLPAHPGAHDVSIARPESRKGLGSWSTRDHENGEVSSDAENREVSNGGGDPALGRLATHKNGADGQLAPVTGAVVSNENTSLQKRVTGSDSQNKVSQPDSTADASGAVGSVPELAFGNTGFGGVGSERTGVEGDTADDRSTVEGLTGRPQQSHRDDAYAAEYSMGDDASNLNGVPQPPAEAEAESLRSGGKKVTHTPRRSGINGSGVGGGGGASSFGADHQFEAVGVSVRSRMDQGNAGAKSQTDQGGGDGGSYHLDDNRSQRPRPSNIPGRAQNLRRKSNNGTENNVAPEKGEGQRDGQGVHRHASSGSIRRHGGPDQQYRGIVPATDVPVDPSKRGAYGKMLKAGQAKENDETKGNHNRPGAIAGSRVGETRTNRRPRQTATAAAGGAVGEGQPRQPSRPVIEVPHAVHPRLSNNGIAGTALDGDGKINVYDANTAEGNGASRARGVRVFVPAKEVDEDPRQRIEGRKVAPVLPTGGSLPHTKTGSMAVLAEPAMGVTGRMPKGGRAATGAAGEPATGAATGRTPKGGGTAAGERGQYIVTSEEGTPRIPPKQKTSPATVRPTRHGRISREPHAITGDMSPEMRRPQREQHGPEFRAESLSLSNSVETPAARGGSLDDRITKGKGTPLRVVLGRQDRVNNRERLRRSVPDDHETNHGHLSGREGAHREAVPDRLHPPLSARGEQYSSRGVGGGKWNAAYHGDTSRPEHYDGHDGSIAGNTSGANGRLSLGTKKRISPWANDSPRDSRGIVSSNESLKIRRAPAPPESGGRWDGPADRTEPGGGAAARGRGRKELGVVDQDIYMTARPYHADHTFRNSRQRGGPSHNAHEILTSAQPGANNGIGSHWGYAQPNRDDRPEAERLLVDNRFSRPPRPNPVRPRTTPVSVNLQQHDDQQKLRRIRELNGSDRERGRSGSLHDREMVIGPPVQSHQDGRMSFPSGRQEDKRPEDWRPMLGPLNAPQWGRPWQSASASDVSVLQEESLPYYVDRKQVWQFFPDLGLPPWRTPAPGEPGWDPILNYCEVKQDEDQMTEDRKRREYLCRRRTQSRGGDWSTTTGGSSSLEGHNSGHDFDTPRVSPRKRTNESVVPEEAGGREEEEEGYGEGGGGGGSARIAIARKINARRPPPAATAAAAEPKQHGKRVYFHDPPGLLGGVGSPSRVRNPAPTSNLRRFKTLVRGNGQTRTPVSVEEVISDRYRREGSTTGAMTAGRLRASSAVAPSHFLRPLMGTGEATSPYAVATDFSPPGQVHFMSAVAPPRMVEGRAAAPVGKRYRHRHMSLSVADNPPYVSLAGIISRYRQGGGFYLPSHAKAAQAGPYPYLPSQAKAVQAAARGDGYKYRRRSDHSPTRVLYAAGAAPAANSSAATGAPAFASSSAGRYTNVGGSRWSQDVRLQQHARGRSRLAPSTRTAGGRWGSNHGRLEALFPWEESPPHPPDWERWENGPWVLDLDPNLY